MAMGITALTYTAFNEIGNLAVEHLPQLHEISAYCMQMVAAMGGPKIIALLLLAGFNIGIMALIAYVALRIT